MPPKDVTNFLVQALAVHNQNVGAALTLDEAAEVLCKFYAAYPEVKRLRDSRKRRVHAQVYDEGR